MRAWQEKREPAGGFVEGPDLQAQVKLAIQRPLKRWGVVE